MTSNLLFPTLMLATGIGLPVNYGQVARLKQLIGR